MLFEDWLYYMNLKFWPNKYSVWLKSCFIGIWGNYLGEIIVDEGLGDFFKT